MCSYSVTFIEVGKKDIWRDKKRIRHIDPTTPARSRVSLSVSSVTFAIASFPLKKKGTLVSSLLYRTVSGSFVHPLEASVHLFPADGQKQTFLWLSYVIKYTVKQIIYISPFWCCSFKLCARAHWPSAQPKNNNVFHTKINSTFTLLSILWSQTGHVKQSLSNLILPISWC